jgi:hypothetical protein
MSLLTNFSLEKDLLHVHCICHSICYLTLFFASNCKLAANYRHVQCNIVFQEYEPNLWVATPAVRLPSVRVRDWPTAHAAVYTLLQTGAIIYKIRITFRSRAYMHDFISFHFKVSEFCCFNKFSCLYTLYIPMTIVYRNHVLNMINDTSYMWQPELYYTVSDMCPTH